MRKLVLLIVLVMSLVLPAAAGAQDDVIFNQLYVALWPEYDKPSMLVLYDFSLAPGTTFPAEVVIRIPGDADLIAVAKQAEDAQLINVPYNFVEASDWQEITINIDSQVNYHIEYYDNSLVMNDNQRSYVYNWLGDYQVNTLVVEFQEPTETIEFSSTPELPNSSASSNGLPMRSGTFSSIKQGETWNISISYARTTDALSIEGQPVQGSSSQPSSSSSLSDYLPFILGGAAVLLIAVGLFWFWQSGRDTSSNRPGRKRHTNSSPSTQAGGNEGQVYCHECGKRAQSGDKFCRVCGAKLRL